MARRNNKKNENSEESKPKKNTTIDYLSPLNIEKEFDKHGIDKQRLEIIKEYSTLLIYTTHKTYFGKEYIKSYKQIEDHFNWCFKSVNDKFAKIGFRFDKTYDVYNYFFEHLQMHMYNNNNYNEDTDLNLDIIYFKDITNYSSPKTEDDLLLLLQIDILFKKSLKFVKNLNN